MSLLVNGNFELWSSGVNVAPDGWALTGVSAAVARESSSIESGTYAANITRVGADASLKQSVQSIWGIDYFKGKVVIVSAWVYATVAARARLRLDDGAFAGVSSAHSGTPGWELLTAQLTISSGATEVTVSLQVITGNTDAYFDLVALGVESSGVEVEGVGFDTVSTIGVDAFYQIDTANLYLDILSEVDITLLASKNVDLMKLVPEKFKDSVALAQFLRVEGLVVGTWLSKIDDMKYLFDPYSVSDELKTIVSGVTYTVDEEYVSRLAALIGLTITKNPGDTIDIYRRQLTQAIDWYKLKGSYQAMLDAIYATGQNISVKDMYTNDYVTFTTTDWFVGDYPGELPPEFVGLSPTYYKSPHFGLEIDLNQEYSRVGDNSYLWHGENVFIGVQGYVEQVRPANTVPHYLVKMVAPCNENGQLTTTSYGVSSRRIYEPWVFSSKYFDEGYLPGKATWNFDDAVFLDFGDTSLLNSISWARLGNGNKGGVPSTSGWGIEQPAFWIQLQASNRRLYSDRTEFEVVIPAPGSVPSYYDLSELGLYLGNQTSLIIGCNFPDIDMMVGVEIHIVVVMYK